MYGRTTASKFRSMGSGFFALFFLLSFFLVGTSMARASDVAVPIGFTLPHSLPYNDGTTVWTHWTAMDQGDNWIIYYHNVPNFFVEEGNIVSLTSNRDTRYLSSWNEGISWNVEELLSSLPEFPTYNGDLHNASVYITSLGYTAEVRNRIFADYPYFARDTYDSGIYTYWLDFQTYSFGDVMINKVNFDIDGHLLGVQDPAIYQIVNNTSSLSDYTSLPSPITDPTGFISGVFTNFFVFIYKGFLPPDGYLTTKLAEVTSAWSLDQPGLVSVSSAFSTGIASLSTPTAMTPISIGSLHIGGASTSSITVFDPSTQPVGMFDSAKTLISAFMYFGVGFWVIRQMSSIFSA